ncbi:MAG: DUF2183 domain-containing protein, partial [Pirellulaceae bacterium]|nr:DUF2183 domain-containing protein [Pirellulaceae bacterium]
MPPLELEHLFIDEKITLTLFPAWATWNNSTHTWKLHLQGVLAQPGKLSLRRKVLLRLLKKLMHADVTDYSSPHFKELVSGFLQDGMPKQQIDIQLGQQSFPLAKRSKKSGYFSGSLSLGDSFFQEMASDKNRDDHQHGPKHSPGPKASTIEQPQPTSQLGHPSLQNLIARPRFFPDLAKTAPIHRLFPEGVSVISDIDDTIKETNVLEKKELLRNTFLKPFQPIEGMAQVYQDWKRRGADFHYISSSPWQIYQPLGTFISEFQFPTGTFHLRSFRLRDHLLKRFLLLRQRGKSRAILALLGMLPKRRFILVGDSGVRDPEIYGRLARKYPEQMEAIARR